jgi:colicin import membrane protein
MIKSTFLSIGFHVFFILIAYYGLPSIKAKEIIEQPIDIVEDTPVSSKTSLKLGNKKTKKVKKVAKNIKRKTTKKSIVPPPPPKPKDKVLERRKEVIKKLKETKKIAKLIKKKPVLKIKKNNVVKPPKSRKKPKLITQKQNEQLAKGILNTLTKPQPISEKEKNKKNIQKLKSKILQVVGNSNKRVAKTSFELSQTERDKLKNHIGKCWEMSIGAGEVKTIIPLKISANADGTINSIEIVDNSLYTKNTFYRATADSARRAVLDCSPLPIPKNKSEAFRNFILDFDTSFIYSN